MPLTNKQISSFQETVLSFYAQHGRHHLPWRTSHTTPYHILVSEVMLQQTQVDRVTPKFLEFIGRFPSIADLAKASQSDVVRLWSGLGYNRRARFLHVASQHITQKYHGIVPNTLQELISIPGIGRYTASAILAFAFNKPVSVIETNIRTVYIHHFLPDHESVRDELLLPLITTTIDTDDPRRWYAALMDYGAHLKKAVGNLSKKSKTYVKQSRFVGSNRQLRGAIIKKLAKKSPQPLLSLTKVLIKTYHADQEKITEVFKQLETERLITRTKSKVSLL